MDAWPLFLEQIGFRTAIWFFLVAVAIHELEEWNIAAFERKHFTGLPSVHSDRSARGVIAFVIGLGLALCVIATVPGDPAIAAWIMIPGIAFMLMNSFQHLVWAILMRAYPPGLATTICLVLPIGCWLMVWAISALLVPLWYVVIWTCVAGFGVAHTIKAGKEMTAIVSGAYQIGDWIAERLSGTR